MKKKIIFALSGLLLSTNLYAGDYDGYWQESMVGSIGGGDYLSIIQNQDSVVMAWFGVDPATQQPGTWKADAGFIANNIATMNTLIAIPGTAGCDIRYKVTFSSPAQGEVEYTAFAGVCGAIASQLVGVKTTIRKVF